MMWTSTLLVGPALCLAGVAAASETSAILSAMDAAAAGFVSVRAHIEKASYTAVIQDTTVESGQFRMSRGGRGREVRMRVEIAEPDARTIVFAGRKGEIYYPKIQTVHEYDLGRHKAVVDSFLLLGFGTSGKALAKDYTIRYGGAETVNGVAADRLELTPKAAKTRERFSRVELWVAREGAYPVQQKFHAPGGDTTTITYTNIEWNVALSEKDLTLALPAGVKRELPQR